MNKFLLQGVICLSLVFSFSALNAQKHSTCNTAKLLLMDQNCNGNPLGNGVNTGDPTGFDDTDDNACSSQYSKGDDYIFLYAATTSQALKLDLFASDACVILVTSQCPTTGQCEAVSTSINSENQSLVTEELIPGTKYYIHISSNGDENSAGQFCLDAELVTPPAIPSNDECINATTLTLTSELDCSIVTPGTVYLATASPENNAACDGNENDDVWFQFVAAAEVYAIRIINLENLNGGEYLKHSLWEGNCGSLTLKNDCPFTNQSVQHGLTIGETYYLRVFTQFDGPTSIAFDICMSTIPSPPANDECANAIELFPSDIKVCYGTGTEEFGTVAGATASPEPTNCVGAEDDDVWFKFKATSTNHLVWRKPNYSYSTDFIYDTAWEGECGSLSIISCDETSPLQMNDLTIGETYYIRLYSEESIPSINRFDICVSTPSEDIENDDCIDAITLNIPESETCGSPISITNKDITETDHEENSCDTYLNYGMWYEFEAPSNGAFVFESLEGSPGIAVYQGPDCANAAPLTGKCVSPLENGGTVYGLTPGEDYWAMVWTNKPYTFNIEFCIYSSDCIVPDFTAVVNDNSCPDLEVTIDVFELGTATSVDVTCDIGLDSYSDVGTGTYKFSGYSPGVEDVITFYVADHNDPSCIDSIEVTIQDSCIPNCSEGQTIGCGENVSNIDLTGQGQWSVFACNDNPLAIEQVFRFNPAVNGDYTLSVENLGGTGWINYYYRTDGECNKDDWICLGEVYSTSTQFTIPNLEAEQKVYILLDGQIFYDGRIHSFRIDCPTAPCTMTASRVYVDESAEGDNSGCSWFNAFPTIQMAFNAKELNPAITEIWVANGTYYPTYSLDRSSSFSFDEDLSLYGGFEGNETDINQRNIAMNPTILSGDLGTTGSIEDNSLNIIKIGAMASDVVIDGFEIMLGYANGYNPGEDVGAGIVCYGNAELVNCTIQQCTSLKEGAAIKLNGVGLTLTCEDVTTMNNTSGGNGNDVSIEANSTLVVKGVTSIK
ncbi:MAG: hypothetical protein P1U56_17295 [Saprospiraceae bacterium]|nr:hypothetical protein [Saprospiraceae bacterium]